MSKFKVGDKVRMKGDLLKREYVIQYTDAIMLREGLNSWFYESADRFELVPEEVELTIKLPKEFVEGYMHANRGVLAMFYAIPQFRKPVLEAAADAIYEYGKDK